jgi:hypothetical protein
MFAALVQVLQASFAVAFGDKASAYQAEYAFPSK